MPETGLIVEMDGDIDDVNKVVEVMKAATAGEDRHLILGDRFKVYYKPSEWKVIET